MSLEALLEIMTDCFLNPFLLEFIIPAEPLNAGDKMAAPGRYPKRARKTTSSAFFWPKW